MANERRRRSMTADIGRVVTVTAELKSQLSTFTLARSRTVPEPSPRGCLTSSNHPLQILSGI